MFYYKIYSDNTNPDSYFEKTKNFYKKMNLIEKNLNNLKSDEDFKASVERTYWNQKVEKVYHKYLEYKSELQKLEKL